MAAPNELGDFLRSRRASLRRRGPGSFVVVPVLLGGGLRLFPEGSPNSAWTLIRATILADGAIGHHYRRA